MNEHITEQASAPLTLGQTLVAGREARSLSLEEAANRLHLNPRILEELENDTLAAGVELPFMRGYLRNYGKLLGLSGDALVVQFDELHHRLLLKKPTVTPAMKTEQVPMDDPGGSWGYVLGGVLLLALGAAYFWWQSSPGTNVVGQLLSGDKDELAAPASTVAVPADEVRRIALEPASSSTPSSNPSAPATAPVSPAAPGSTAEQASTATPLPSAALPETAAATPSATPSATTPAAETVAAASLALRFQADCWIKIEDAKGEVLSRGLKKAGDALKLAGVPPFNIVLGNPGSVSMTFQGQAVDLSKYPLDQVAKLQVGEKG